MVKPFVALAALAASFVVHGDLLSRLRAVEPAKPWWFGYARDGVNLSAALMTWGGYLLLGFRAPEALLAAMLTTLVTYVLDWVIARALRRRRARLWLALPLGGWLVALAILHAQIGLTIARLIVANQPL